MVWVGDRDIGVEVVWNFHFPSAGHVTLNKVFKQTPYSYRMRAERYSLGKLVLRAGMEQYLRVITLRDIVK